MEPLSKLFYREIIFYKETFEIYKQGLRQDDLSSECFEQLVRQLEQNVRELFQKNVEYASPTKKNSFKKIIESKPDIYIAWLTSRTHLEDLLRLIDKKETVKTNEIWMSLVDLIEIMEVIVEKVQDTYPIDLGFPDRDLKCVTTEFTLLSSKKIYNGRIKLKFCRRLGDKWYDLADFFDITPYERGRFMKGREPQGIWEWLEERNKLDELEEAIIFIERDDLIDVLHNEQFLS